MSKIYEPGRPEGDRRDEIAGRLAELGLMPDLRFLAPPPRPAGHVDFTDRYRGALVWGAAGDALGRPGEGRSAETVRERFGRLENFMKWSGWRSGPIGTITDDTQMTMCVADGILEAGRVDPVDLARRFVEWLPIGRGKGAATVQAVERLAAGEPWYSAGSDSAGNGAAMRAAPVGLRFPQDPEDLVFDAVVSAVPTHRQAMAAASTVMVAAGVAFCVQTVPGALDPESFTAYLVGAGGCVDDQGAFERKPGSKARVRLAERVAEVPGRLGDGYEDTFSYFYNGAFVLESLPAAIWCFLEYLDDPEEGLIIAASQGRDSDTVASMAGNLIGAYRGVSALPDRWHSELEYLDELEGLADGLLALSSLADATE